MTNGCNAYGEWCDGNPIYVELPHSDTDFRTWPQIAAVDNGTTLVARCWAVGREYVNYRLDALDLGPDPYASSIHYNVQTPDGSAWGWIPDTWFVRDQDERLGLPQCGGTD